MKLITPWSPPSRRGPTGATRTVPGPLVQRLSRASKAVGREVLGQTDDQSLCHHMGRGLGTDEDGAHMILLLSAVTALAARSATPLKAAGALLGTSYAASRAASSRHR